MTPERFVKAVVIGVVTLFALGLLAMQVWVSTRPHVTPQEAAQIQKRELESIKQSAPFQASPGKYQPPKGFVPPVGE
ncbi:MAG: hypothetical protein SLRJCFUN_001681 [Candidatus Fervidibacter sp.]